MKYYCDYFCMQETFRYELAGVQLSSAMSEIPVFIDICFLS